MADGYFVKGFADQFSGGLMGGNRDRLAKERFEYLKEQAEKKAAQDIIIQQRQNNLRNRIMPILTKHDPTLEGSDLPLSFLQEKFKNYNTNQDLVEDNTNFGLMSGMKMPPGASLPNDMLKTGVDAYKHLNPQPATLTGDAGNAQILAKLAKTNPVLANSIYNKMVQLKQAGANKTNINTQEDKIGFMKFSDSMKHYNGILDKSDESVSRLNNINAIRSIPLDTDGDVLVGMKNTLRKIGHNLGVPVDVEKMNNIEMASTKANSMALDVLAGFSGATSEKELQFSKDTTYNINQPEETRAWILDVSEASELSKQGKAEFYQNYLINNDGSPVGVRIAWNNHKKTLPSTFGHYTNTQGKKRPVTWYTWKKGVIQATLAAGQPMPSEQELKQEWETNHVDH